MSIEFDKEAEIMSMTCDTCGIDAEFYGCFTECIVEAKHQKWAMKLVDGEWEHYCPDCKAIRQGWRASEVFR